MLRLGCFGGIRTLATDVLAAQRKSVLNFMLQICVFLLFPVEK